MESTGKWRNGEGFKNNLTNIFLNCDCGAVVQPIGTKFTGLV